jgi:hypothetical protein
MLEVDWSRETTASRVSIPDAELPISEIKAKPKNGKSPINFLAMMRPAGMA